VTVRLHPIAFTIVNQSAVARGFRAATDLRCHSGLNRTRCGVYPFTYSFWTLAMAKDDEIIANQKTIIANQTKLLANQAKLDKVLANQEKVEANQAKILANQETILKK
jgi:hypothetical protein